MWRDKNWGDYKFHLVILVCCILAEAVGPIKIPVGGVTVTLLPLLYSMIFVLIVYMIKPIRFVKEKQAEIGSALPIALLLGMGREAVGMTHAMSREPNVALISDMFGADSAEFKGVMTCYIVGTIFGTIFMSIVPPIFVSLGIFSPESAAMAVGAGSASMMTAGLAGVMEAAPAANPDVLTAFASISNVISSSISVYLGLFITVPLGNVIYKAMKKGK